ncbi:hypothetical protein EV363DRAFT_691829 [Boletus edulis]|nr:hypothetical protein EV363DRAFT_691829 [Boletus edulis]
MHHALHIAEILHNIFGHCHPADSSWTIERGRSTADLVALAQTCRMFKEPALDVLWSELIDLSPLAFCLPEHHRSSSSVLLFFHLGGLPECLSPSSQCHSFIRPRNDTEWDTLRSYTRRVKRIVGFSSPYGQLDPSCIAATFNTPLADPLFPNLRFLTWQGGRTALPVMNFAVPSLTSLDIRSAPWEDVSLYTHLLDTLVPQCPNIRKVRIQAAHDVGFGETVHRHLRSWNNLQVVDCLHITMPADVIPYLSSTSTLLWLSFTLNTQSPTLIPAPNPLLVFSQLVYLEVISESLTSVTSLLAHVQLPAVQVFIFPFSSCPSRATVQSHLATLHTACASNTLTDLRLLNLRSPATPISALVEHTPRDDDRLTLDDVRPCMAFGNLRAIHVNLEWSIDLTDTDLFTLVTAWPHIEHLVINDRWGWRTARGITLDGLRLLLQRCKRLWELCIVVDTESAVNVPARPLDVDVSLRRPFRLNVADSPIRREAVPALGTIFSVFGFSYNLERFIAWNGAEMGDIPGAHDFRYLWRSVIFEDNSASIS